MNLRIQTVLLISCLTAMPVRAQEAPAPNEDNCRKAIAAGLEMLRQIPPDITVRDDEDRRKLLEVMERLVETNRSQGVSECRTWSDLMRKAFNQ